ncbi:MULTISPECIES: OmpA family protein [Leptotrichia]|uniref:OmpA family protein n=1 Tax=Leptotrichia TaxID=32067 RepID=UPI0015B80637|nr:MULTISPECIES: OmpA family protein [Leptotrichia]NWO19439.1 OmpA family protein [Leptotrichia sp. oral taxon 223]
MEKKSKITAMLSVLLVSAPTTAKKITTSNLRDNAMRTTAVEVDGTNIEQLDIAEEEKSADNADIIVLDTNKLKFDFNSATIKEEYTPILEKLKNYIEAKNEKISIIGYTDSKGTKEYNKELSLRRAESLEEKLIDLGLSPDKIIETKGNGDNNPIASNDTEEGRAINRRIEVQFVR